MIQPSIPYVRVQPEDRGTDNGVTISGDIPTWDGTYFFDDPDLYFDQAYPANEEHTQAERPKVESHRSF